MSEAAARRRPAPGGDGQRRPIPSKTTVHIRVSTMRITGAIETLRPDSDRAIASVARNPLEYLDRARTVMRNRVHRVIGRSLPRRKRLQVRNSVADGAKLLVV